MADTPYIDDTETNKTKDNTTPVNPEEGGDNTDNGIDIGGEEGPTLPLEPGEVVDPPIPNPDPIPTDPVPEPDPVDPEEGGIDVYYATWRGTAPEVGEDGVIEKVPYDPLPNIESTLIDGLEDGREVHPEDYFFSNQDKELVQVRFGMMLRAIESYCPMEIDRYPGASTLKNLIIAIAEDLHTLKASDIGYDGELGKKYGTVKAIITYILDTINTISSSGIRGDGITIDPTGDTPQFVIEDLEGANRLVDIINYIYNNFRYSGVAVPGSEVLLSGSEYNAIDFDLSKVVDQNGKISVQNMMNRMYKYVTSTLDHTVTLRTTNKKSHIIFQSQSAETICVCSMPILGMVTTDIEFEVQIYIDCDLPGILVVSLSEDDATINEDNELDDALTTGPHILHYKFFDRVVREDGANPTEKLVFLTLAYFIDTEVEFKPYAAVIRANGIIFTAKGQHLSTFTPTDNKEGGNN